MFGMPDGRLANFVLQSIDGGERRRMVEHFKRRFGDRVVALPLQPRHSVFLGTLAACDVNLDSVNYSGGITSVDAMNAGRPRSLGRATRTAVGRH